MKIISGLSNVTSANEIENLVQSGVDEFFIGYIPKEWSDKYGFEVSCNRREHSKYHYTTSAEIEQVVELIHKANKKVFLTLNAHEYSNEQIKLLLKILKGIKHIRFDAFIVSNLALMLELRNAGYELPINISIGGGCNSAETILFYNEYIGNIGRFILPRKVTAEEIEHISSYLKTEDIKLEAFCMVDTCFFNDEYCFTWHGESNKSFCQSPMYQHKEVLPLIFDEQWKSKINSNPVSRYVVRYAEQMEQIENQHGLAHRKKSRYNLKEMAQMPLTSKMSKCGLCAFQKFKDWGIDAVKLPLRGYDQNFNNQIIKIVKQVIDQRNASPDFCRKLIGSPTFCNGENCFYNYPYSN